MGFIMCSKIVQHYIAVTSKLYCNAVVYSLNDKFLAAQLKFPVFNHASLSRCYSQNKSELVSKEYDKKYEEQLNKNLEDPKYKAEYTKVKLEVNFLQCQGAKVPANLKANNWLFLLETDKQSQRRAYLEYLWKIEKKEANLARKKLEKQAIKEEECLTERKQYQMGFNTLFHRIQDKQIMHFYNSRLITAMLYSSSIVFDLAYDEYMTPTEKQLCAKQLLFAFSENRLHDDPCNLYFCNADKDSIILQSLHKTIPVLYDQDFPLNITSKSYLEIFDKSRLVYLTPHCMNTMTHYDHNAVYIVGAVVDKINNQPISFQKARKEGIKMVKFPLSEKLEWGIGSSKTLPLNHVLSILLDLRHTNDWNIALRHVPQRKLKQQREKNLLKTYERRQKLIDRLITSGKN